MDRSTLGRTLFERRPRSLARVLLGSLIGLLGGLLLPSAALAIDEFLVPTPASQPAGITVGPDGAIWFTEENGHKIGRITTTGSITEYPIPTPAASPQEIVAGPDGALWFTEYGANPPKIGRITTAGVITNEYEVPGPGSSPDGITSGPDGALWFTEYGSNEIGRITTAGSITEYPLPNGIRPGDITTGPDGRLWFTESEGQKVGAINPATGSIQEYDRPGTDPSGIAASGASLWFTKHSAHKIENISTAGTAINEFPTGTGPSGIAFGSDNALWFTETLANKIGRMTTGGSLTEFVIPTPESEPGDIVAGPDGALWFTEFALGANKIGRIRPGSSLVPPPPPPPLPAARQAGPSVLSLGISPSKFRAAPRGSSISRARTGATVTYRLSVAATTRFTVERETAGRRKGKRCVPQTRRNRRARRCKRYVTVRGSFSHRGKAAVNRFRFTGRLARKRLRPARYRLAAVATVGSAKSTLKRANFRIVRR
jgi:virginiamycin B lyase